MQKKVVFVTAFVMVATAAVYFTYLPKPNSNREPASMKHQGRTFHGNRFILTHGNVDQIEGELPRHGARALKRMHHHRQSVVAEMPPEVAQKLLEKHPDLKIIEDYRLSIVPEGEFAAEGHGPKTFSAKGRKRPTTSTQQIPWGMQMIQVPDAIKVTAGAGIKVCVVDTGVDQTHPDLKANIVGGRNFVMMGSSVDPTRWNDDNGHGSHVSGIIAAVNNTIGTIGVAPQAKIYAVKALDSTGSGYLSDIADGVTECVQAGAKVINMSLGATQDPNLDSPFKTAVENAAAAGVKIVVAAGNSGVDISGTVPAGYSQVIAVAAIDSSKNFPTWSNFGLSAKDFSAPGVDIYSTWKSGAYNTISGTSMASPHVAGVVALYLAAGSRQIVADDLGRAIGTQGAGLVNALKTVNAR